MLVVRKQNGAASTLDFVKVIVVGLNSWKSGMEKDNASHQDKSEILCLDKNNQVHQYCLGDGWLGSRAAEKQLVYGKSQAECMFTLSYRCETVNTLMRWVNKSNDGKQK